MHCTVAAPSMQAENVPSFLDGSDLAAEISCNSCHRFDQLIIVLRRLPVRKIDVVFEPETDDVDAERGCEDAHWKLVFFRCDNLKCSIGKAAPRFFLCEDQMASRCRHGAEAHDEVE